MGKEFVGDRYGGCLMSNEEQPCWPHTLTAQLGRDYLRGVYGEFTVKVVCSECGFKAAGMVDRLE